MATRQRKSTVQSNVPARLNTDAFERGKLMSQAERVFGKQNPDAILHATGGQKLSAGVGLTDDKEDAFALQIRWVKDYLDAKATNSGLTPPTRPQYTVGVLGDKDAQPRPIGPNAKACAAGVDLLSSKLADKTSMEDGITFNFLVDGTTELARVIHDVLFYAGELLSAQQQEEYEKTPCQIRFLGGKTVIDPVVLGTWLESEAATENDTTSAPTAAQASDEEAEEAADDVADPPPEEGDESEQVEDHEEPLRDGTNG